MREENEESPSILENYEEKDKLAAKSQTKQPSQNTNQRGVDKKYHQYFIQFLLLNSCE